MKILLMQQTGTQGDVEFTGRIIDGLRSHDYEVLPYARILQAEAQIGVVHSGPAGLFKGEVRLAPSVRQALRASRDDIRSCDALMFVQHRDVGKMSDEAVKISWFLQQDKLIIVARGPMVTSDVLEGRSGHIIDWSEPQELIDAVGAGAFKSSVTLMLPKLASAG